ncbi:cytochrome c oxidase subunit II transmembrane domain-containing protein [Humisphaera borealis]|uniref:Cytochrome c oxidase subunit 2 n=1 Tax=Humisphaera borealis TaxID=2807512 RepID=A0A7M2X0X6_9BACT|nr:cytochrome c oxidase subunit II transmembrane domain-containing protein [Humisphaera borealis]QOV91314.1 hypothetical protein IPV69_08140 [Humisphaera borealis]
MINISHHLATTLCPTLAQAQGWRKWWLPENYSEHGGGVDLLFNVIFWVTGVVGVVVLLLLLKYCIQYRYRPDRKAHFTHGNKKVELIWTIIPAILLIALAIWTKGAWDEFRYGTKRDKAGAAKILVIAEQFNWNTIYPGPDGKLGRYLVFPKTTDARWPALPPGQETFFQDGYSGMSGGKTLPPGPAFLPKEISVKLINDYIGINKLGKDFSDPAGEDDDWREALGRPVTIPKGRLVEVELTSKDVIHDFFLPHFRVKLDAVPGMRGLLYFTPTQTSAEYQKASEAANKREYTIDEAKDLVAYGLNLRILVPEDPAQAAEYAYSTEREVTKRVRGKMEKVIEKVDVQLANGDRLTNALIEGLKAKGTLKKFNAYAYQEWELVCEELCGNGHTGMRGSVLVIDAKEYSEKFEGKAPAAAPTTALPATPVVARAAAE